MRTLARIRAHAEAYQLVHCDLAGVNAFFVGADLAAGRFPAAADVVVRAPNYWLRGGRHPPGSGAWEAV